VYIDLLLTTINKAVNELFLFLFLYWRNPIVNTLYGSISAAKFHLYNAEKRQRQGSR